MREWRGTIGRLNCAVQRFRGPDDLLALLREPAASRRNCFTDWFNGDRPSDPRMMGFSDPGEIAAGLRTGAAPGTEGAGPGSARTLEVERLCERRRDVAGGAVIVPAMVAGEPACMWTLRRRKVRSRAVGLCVDTAMVWNRTPEEYRVAGQAVMDAVTSLERAGYRVRLDVAYTTYSYRCSTRVMGMSMPVKGLGEPMNRRRAMWCLTDVAFMRGAGFAWQAHLPDMTDSSLGTDVEHAWRGPDRQAFEDELFDRLSPGSAHVCMSDMVNVASERGREGAAGWVASQIVG